MNRGIPFILGFLFLSFFSSAQELSQTVIASQGSYDRADDIALEWTLGEVIAATTSTRSVLFTQGFNQPFVNETTTIVDASNGNTGTGSNTNGANTNQELISVSALPNPFENELTLVVNGNVENTVDVNLYNTNGVVVKKATVNANENQVTLDVADLPAAIYFLYATDQSGRVSETISVFKFK